MMIAVYILLGIMVLCLCYIIFLFGRVYENVVIIREIEEKIENCIAQIKELEEKIAEYNEGGGNG